MNSPDSTKTMHRIDQEPPDGNRLSAKGLHRPKCETHTRCMHFFILLFIANCMASISDSLYAGLPDSSVTLLKLEQTTTLNGTTIYWDRVSDSRCAAGTKCFTEGKVTVNLVVTKEQEGRYHTALSLGASQTNSHTTTIDNIKIDLLSVYPLPGMAKKPYVVTLQISPL